MKSSKSNYLDKALDWVTKKASVKFKAKMEGYEPTRVFTNQETGDVVQADFSFVTHGGSKSYTDIAIKSDTPQKLVSRWKLLSLMASMKRGKLFLLAPKGHKMFTERLINKYNINAEVRSI